MDIKPVKFNKPPVVEVACGILFANPNLIKSVDIGRFWQLIKKDFPRAEEAPPLDPLVEDNNTMGLGFHQMMSFAHLPPMRRVWFISEDGRSLIQVQSDRFLFNWKRTQTIDEYPSYQKVMEKFDHYLDVFEKFCIDVEIPAPVYRQFELVYVNHISKSNGLNLVSPDSIFVDHTRLTLENRFLPSPSLINWITSYALPDDSGRLHISMQSAFSNHPVSEEVVRMDLTARGIPKEIGRAHV